MNLPLLLIGVIAGWWIPGEFSEATFHDLHISKTELAYNPEDQAIQMSLHIFTDDLERGIEAMNGATDLKISTEHEKEEATQWIYDYLSTHLQLTIDGERRAFDWVGKEPTPDYQAVWIYLEIPGIPAVQDLEVRYDVLMELYDDQRNILMVMDPQGKRTYHLFEPKQKTVEIHF
ncbi:MAG TPA: hypothetical protein P5275_06880 [Saprospiraceae bacterium]|nr:hypothetical protein [Saprospiraceae bacterium]MCB9270931.1 hypothetical protein [Lewinellaceae bacterium]HPG08186.1 hypothetical protein [Saprospiraceae bacterium]HPQ98194.1 hypothetical protein [Saprospiraceae bacterium]HRV84566.1 hypothetical protein [Saprospiraceae bacterium]